MTTGPSIDGVLVEWGERLFYPPSRIVKPDATPRLNAAKRPSAAAIRQRIAATVVRRAPQVMVKVTGGGRGMGAIAAHFRYICKNGQLRIEDDRGVVREGKEADQGIGYLEDGTMVVVEGGRRYLNQFITTRPADREKYSREFRIFPPGAEMRWVSTEAVSRALPDGSIVIEGVLVDQTDVVKAKEESERIRAELLSQQIEQSRMKEREQLLRTHRPTLLTMGVIAGYLGAAPAALWALGVLALALAPFILLLSVWIYTLVFAFAALWFAHFLLPALSALRAEASSPEPLTPLVAAGEPS